MPVTLPTSADVRRFREQAAKGAERRAEAVRTPLLAALGASEYVLTAVTKAVQEAQTHAAARREAVQQRVAELPEDLDALRARFAGEELRKTVGEWSEGMRAQAGHAYSDFAERGAKTLERIRRQPQVQRVLETVEAYTEQLDSRVESLVDDAHDAAEKALAAFSTQTRSAGERFARATRQFSRRAADTVTETSKDAAEAVAEAGDEAADEISEAGSDVASTTRRVANRTTPAEHRASTGTSRTTARKSATRRSR